MFFFDLRSGADEFYFLVYSKFLNNFGWVWNKILCFQVHLGNQNVIICTAVIILQGDVTPSGAPGAWRGHSSPYHEFCTLLCASVEMENHCPAILMTAVASRLTGCILQYETQDTSKLIHQRMQLLHCYGLLCCVNVVLTLYLQLHQCNPLPC